MATKHCLEPGNKKCGKLKRKSVIHIAMNTGADNRIQRELSDWSEQFWSIKYLILNLFDLMKNAENSLFIFYCHLIASNIRNDKFLPIYRHPLEIIALDRPSFKFHFLWNTRLMENSQHEPNTFTVWNISNDFVVISFVLFYKRKHKDVLLTLHYKRVSNKVNFN